jgi:5-methylcytosine-specific restriction endonuclease McrA
MNISISPKHQQFFPDLEDLGIFFDKVTDNLFTTDSTTISEVALKRLIVKKAELVSILYTLYATGHLTIRGHEYPTYKLWQETHRRADQKLSEVTLDHILPKSKFPHLAFKVSNWQVMSRDKNKAKGSDYSMADVNKVLGQY